VEEEEEAAGQGEVRKTSVGGSGVLPITHTYMVSDSDVNVYKMKCEHLIAQASSVTFGYICN